jgi:NitT/TauT family transport system ATP-binding protein
MLSIEAVGRYFPGGIEALRDVSLDLDAGAFVALLGPSGCGKSTLLRLIAGLDQPDSGALRWQEGHAPGIGEIGFVFQDATLLPWASAEDNIYLPLRLRGVPRTRAASDIDAVLARVGLTGFERTRPAQLSGGMRMRVSIARALVTRPKLLLMDEPFAALDEFTRHRLQADLLALWQSLGCTVVFVTHSIYEAAFLAQRIVLMTPRPGRIATELTSTLRLGPDRRLDPAYAKLVAAVTHAMEGALAA